MRARAAVLEQAGGPHTVVDDLEVADPRAGEVRVRVTHCGLCHSDVTVVDTGHLLPVVLGHEAAGVVDAVGEGVTGLSPGDHVVLSPIAACGRCAWCVRGEHSLCVNGSAVTTGRLLDGSTPFSRGGEPVWRGLGVGGFAEHTVVLANGAVKIPSDVPLDVACVIGCAVQTGVGAVLNTAKVTEGDTVLVTGLGGVGLAAVQGARLAGASRIIASDPVESRREAALQFGATDVLDPTSDDVVAATRDLTGIGADVAIEAAGMGKLIEQNLQAVRSGGTVVMLGAPPISDGVTIPHAVLMMVTEKKLVGSFLGSSHSLRDVPRLVALWQAGRLDLEAMVTMRRPLDQLDAAIADLRRGVGVRTVLDVAGS